MVNDNQRFPVGVVGALQWAEFTGPTHLMKECMKQHSASAKHFPHTYNTDKPCTLTHSRYISNVIQLFFIVSHPHSSDATSE